VKYLIFAVGLGGVGLLAILLRGNRRWRLAAWTVMGALPFLGSWLPHINLVSHEYYRGDSRGFELTLVDLAALALLAGTPGSGRPSPYRLVRYAYLAVALFSVTQAVSPLFAAFGVWKLLRMYVLLAAVTREGEDPQIPAYVLRGMLMGTLLQVGMGLYQRYGLHLYQSPGFFAHQNTLGMAMNLVLPVSLELLLAGLGGWLVLAAITTGPVTLVLSLSRGAMATFAVVSGFLIVISAARRMTYRKVAVVMLGVVFAAGILYKAGDTIATRFATAPPASAAERRHFNDAAALMLVEHPFGIGLNNYSLAVTDGDYWSRTAGPAGDDGFRQEDTPIPGEHYGGIAHHIYWLTAAEMGYAGFVSFVALLVAPLYSAFRYGFKARRDPRGDVLVGLGTGMLAFHAQGLLEWAFRQTDLSYLYWLAVGVVATLARQIQAGPEAPATVFAGEASAPLEGSVGQRGGAGNRSGPTPGASGGA
jgi:O-antigen ligase